MRPSRIATLSSLLATLSSLLLTGACYSYQPARLESITPGSSVRVRLSQDAADRLTDEGVTSTRLLDGVLLQNGGESLLLDTDMTTGGAARRTLRQRLSIPVSGITEIELKQLDRVKTGVAIGVGVAVVGTVIAAQLAGGFGGDEDPGPEPGELRVPLPIGFRIFAF
jgi:hypothetical protein